MHPRPIEIRSSEVDFHPSSIVDSNGRLFEWHGELLRAVRGIHATELRSMIEGGTIEHLIGRGAIIDTAITEYRLEGYELVLRHRKIPFISYAYEWTPSMLKDAAILYLDIALELSESGLTLQDAHPWNILFDNGARPCFVDIGSIVPTDTSCPWMSREEFLRFFFRPLRLFASGESRIARWLLHDHCGISEHDTTHSSSFARQPSIVDASLLLGRAVKRNFYRHVKRRDRLFGVAKVVRRTLKRQASAPQEDRSSLDLELQEMRKEIETLELGLEDTLWAGYYSRTSYPSFEDSSEWTVKHASVHACLQDLKPSSVLDIASNRGWYSQLAARNGAQVVSFDTDIPSLEILYSDVKAKGSRILPAVMDVLRPSPGYAWLGRGWALPATHRFQVDLVLALALVHHLVFRSSIPATLDHIVDLIGQFSRKWLLVEFIPREDYYVSQWYDERYSWYNLESMRRSLMTRGFSIIKEMPSFPDPRVLLLCQRMADHG